MPCEGAGTGKQKSKQRQLIRMHVYLGKTLPLVIQNLEGEFIPPQPMQLKFGAILSSNRLFMWKGGGSDLLPEGFHAKQTVYSAFDQHEERTPICAHAYGPLGRLPLSRVERAHWRSQFCAFYSLLWRGYPQCVGIRGFMHCPLMPALADQSPVRTMSCVSCRGLSRSHS
jgi:hypothetical protein